MVMSLVDWIVGSLVGQRDCTLSRVVGFTAFLEWVFPLWLLGDRIDVIVGIVVCV